MGLLGGCCAEDAACCLLVMQGLGFRTGEGFAGASEYEEDRGPLPPGRGAHLETP